MSLFNGKFAFKITELWGVQSVLSALGIVTADSLTVTDDITIENGDLLMQQGGIVVDNGDIQAINGDLLVDNGNIVADAGDINTLFGNISANGGEVSANEFIAQFSTSPGSLGYMVVNTGTWSWNSGQAPGANPLPLTGLNGNIQWGYSLIYKFHGEATANTNYLRMRLNNDATSVYANRITQNTSSLVNNNNVTEWHFIDYDAGDTRDGNGKLDIFTSTNQVDSSYATGIMSSSVVGLGNNVQNYKMGYVYNQFSSTNITRFDIDVADNNHTGWLLQFRLIRYQ